MLTGFSALRALSVVGFQFSVISLVSQPATQI